MAARPPSFSFICGADDYLVGRAGKERFDALVSDAAADEYSREIISGFAANMGEVETAINRFREALQTVPMFGGKRVVWLKDVSFLADTITGRADGTLKLVEDLQALLQSTNPDEVSVLVTASPIDRRRSFPKWCEKNSDFHLVGGDDDAAGESMLLVMQAEAKAFGTTLAPGAGELLFARTGPNTRLLVEEIRKLALYVGEGNPIEEKQVAELSPNVAEGDFFETAEAFFKGDLKGTLESLHHHFYLGGSSRPLLAALQNRNRILIQVRALIDSEETRLGNRGLAGLDRAAANHGPRFGVALAEKSSFNLFSQNAWYVGKLAQTGNLPTLRRLIDNQREFVTAFEEVIRRPKEEEEVLREMIVRCLGK